MCQNGNLCHIQEQDEQKASIREQSFKALNILPTLNVEHVGDANDVNGGSDDVASESTAMKKTATFRLFYPETEVPKADSNTDNSDAKSAVTEPLMPPASGTTPTFTVEHYDELPEQKFRTRVASFRICYPDHDESDASIRGSQKSCTGSETSSMLLRKVTSGIPEMTSQPPLSRKSSFRRPHGPENGSYKPKNVSVSDSPSLLIRSSMLTAKPSTLAVTNLEVLQLKRSDSTTSVWRKLNTIRVESCVSLHKQVHELLSYRVCLWCKTLELPNDRSQTVDNFLME